MRAFLVFLTVCYWAIAAIFGVVLSLSAVFPTEVTTISTMPLPPATPWLATALGQSTMIACAIAPVAMIVLNRYGLTALARASMAAPVALYIAVALSSPEHALKMARLIYSFLAVATGWTADDLVS